MRLTRYEAFLRIVELESLTKAAEALGYTQSGLSHMLAALEDSFGVRLLIRSRSGVRLSADGEELLPYIRGVCDRERALENKLRELGGLVSGTLRIGTFTSVSVQWIPAILKAYREAYPDIRVELFYGADSELEGWLAEGRIDCCFVEIPTELPFDTVRLKRDPIYAIVPQGHPLASAPSVTSEELARWPIIWESQDRGEMEAWGKHILPEKTPETITMDDYTIMAMVESGLGISVLPELVMQHTDRRIVKKEFNPPAYRDLGIAVPLGMKPSAAARAFITFAQKLVPTL